MNMDHDKQRSDLLPVAWIDLLLSQGTDLELAQLRALVARDPLAAIEFAETRQVVESFRSVRISPSKEYAQQMCRLVLRANLRCRSMRQQRPVWQRLSQLVAVAAVLVVALAVQATLRINDSAKANEQPVAGNPSVIEWLPPSALAKFYSAAALPDLRAAAERLGSPKLAAAVQRFDDLGAENRRVFWSQASAAVEKQREGYLARVAVELRRSSLASRNAVAIDDRIQQLILGIADDLREPLSLPLPVVAIAVRAVIAGGNLNAVPEQLPVALDRIAAAVPFCRAGELAIALSALADGAVVLGRHQDLVQQHGERLLREFLTFDGDVWERRLPILISPGVPVAQIGEAGRVLSILPEFGVDGEACVLMRFLLAAHLQCCRVQQGDSAELLAAMVYGFGDVMLENDLREVAARLAAFFGPNFSPSLVTLQQLKVSLQPSSLGYAEFRLVAARIDTLPTPVRIFDRAALCLAMAAGYLNRESVSSRRPGF
jgi:hypothetical protein